MKVGMLTTWRVRCGIAAYTEALVDALSLLPGMDVHVEPISPGIQPPEHYADQAARLNACDVVHIQHEYSFWGGFVPGKNRFHLLRRSIERPTVVTAHTTSRIEELIVLPEPLEAGPARARIRQAYRRARMRALFPVLRRARRYRRWIETSPFASADAVIVHTGQALDALASRGIPCGRLHLLPAGVPQALGSSDGGAAFRGRFGLADRRLVTLFGYVNPFKGNELMIAAMKLLPGDVCLVMAGGARTADDEPYVESLRRLAASELPGRAVITGFLSDQEVADAMESSDIVVAPHTLATGSYSVTVPLAYGKPIVASDLACFREIADSARCIALFPAGDSAALAARLRALLDDSAERGAIAAAARTYAVEHAWPRVAEETARIYAAVIA